MRDASLLCGPGLQPIENCLRSAKICRKPDCPEGTARMLFQAMARCEDARLAQHSFIALSTLCGFGDTAAMAGICDIPPPGAVSLLLHEFGGISLNCIAAKLLFVPQPACCAVLSLQSAISSDRQAGTAESSQPLHAAFAADAHAL